MKGFHGIIFAYSASKDLHDLVKERTVASLPFCGRYRLIDFALSSLKNAGVRDVGVIMQRDYQSLLDHIGNGKSWDMTRRDGGIRILPPFGLPDSHRGNYTGTIEALNAVLSYIQDIREPNVILLQGNVCVNMDLEEAMKCHLDKGAEITAICADHELAGIHHHYIIGEDGTAEKLLFDRSGGEGLPSLEGYIIRKEILLKMMDKCRELDQYRFHRDGLKTYLANGGKINVYVHRGYASTIRTVDDYYKASMDMLKKEYIFQIFPADRPVRTKHLEGVSSYYGEDARASNSLVADNCIIEGSIENCIVFSGARIAKGSSLRNCIIMRNCVVESGCDLSYVIADKSVTFRKNVKLAGAPTHPIVIGKKETV